MNGIFAVLIHVKKTFDKNKIVYIKESGHRHSSLLITCCMLFICIKQCYWLGTVKNRKTNVSCCIEHLYYYICKLQNR
jgi:hypothetical protein